MLYILASSGMYVYKSLGKWFVWMLPRFWHSA